MSEVSFDSSRLRTLAYLARCEALNAALFVSTILAPWRVSIRFVCAAAIGTFAVAWGPWRFIGSRVRVFPDRMEYIDRHGRVERMRWEAVTHYSITAFHVRMADASRHVPVLFARPLLVKDRAAFRAILATHCPAAAAVTRVGWWRLVFAAAGNRPEQH
jgi:hypothetical protein